MLKNTRLHLIPNEEVPPPGWSRPMKTSSCSNPTGNDPHPIPNGFIHCTALSVCASFADALQGSHENSKGGHTNFCGLCHAAVHCGEQHMKYDCIWLVPWSGVIGHTEGCTSWTCRISGPHLNRGGVRGRRSDFFLMTMKSPGLALYIVGSELPSGAFTCTPSSIIS